eukprot:TRINITY_DN372_c0_g1_i1.p1 TRINITY_DN372_c0_g1~~TRINITY_DN372_c0_g1_i1.p1  ORF type:complete len:358 (+),score=60.57 TRINITY_DN372_c0_g1_i1:286-1359(+)
MELSILCDCEIGLIIFTQNNKLFQYASDDINSTVDKFRTHTEVPGLNLTNKDYNTEFEKPKEAEDEDSNDEGSAKKKSRKRKNPSPPRSNWRKPFDERGDDDKHYGDDGHSSNESVSHSPFVPISSSNHSQSDTIESSPRQNLSRSPSFNPNNEPINGSKFHQVKRENFNPKESSFHEDSPTNSRQNSSHTSAFTENVGGTSLQSPISNGNGSKLQAFKGSLSNLHIPLNAPPPLLSPTFCPNMPLKSPNTLNTPNPNMFNNFPRSPTTAPPMSFFPASFGDSYYSMPPPLSPIGSPHLEMALGREYDHHGGPGPHVFDLHFNQHNHNHNHNHNHIHNHNHNHAGQHPPHSNNHNHN